MLSREAPPDTSEQSPDQVAELVRSLAAVMRQSEVTELDVELGNVSIRLRRPPRVGEVHQAEAGSAVPVDMVTRIEPGHLVTAPMVGTFYMSPTPSASPFVIVGDEVHAGQTIGIIEAMKIMNEITTDRSGIVQEMLVMDGQPVEYGSPLFRLESQGARP